MLRQCIQSARRRANPVNNTNYCRQWSTLPNDNDERQSSRQPPPAKKHQHTYHPRYHHQVLRHFGISRHPDPLIPREDRSLNTATEDDELSSDSSSSSRKVKKVITADDLEGWNRGESYDDDEMDGDDYRDIFGGLFNNGNGDGDDNGDGDNTRGRNGNHYDDDDDDDDALHNAVMADQERHLKIKEELDKRTGRLFGDEWIIPDEEWMSSETWDDIEEWRPELATRKSLESVKVFENGVPTLLQLSTLPLPPQPPPHPGHGTPATYSKHRRKHIQSRIRTAIQISIHDDLIKMLQMVNWEEKQAAVDELFEVIEERVREKEPILGKLPEFGGLVEDGLEQVLRMVQSRMRNSSTDVAATDDDVAATANDVAAAAEGDASKNSETKKNDTNLEDVVDIMNLKKDPPVPIFMDLVKHQQSTLSEFFTESNDAGVPNLVYPLNVHHNDGVGRMVEEWELAANKETKRIMMRDAMKEIASKVVGAANCCGGSVEDKDKGAARVFVVGKRGAGKTAALAGMVASARVSGHIVVYLPDGDRLRKHGFYVEPSAHRKGLFDLPEIAKEFCEQLLSSHGSDISAMKATKEGMKNFLTDGQIERVFSKVCEEEEDGSDTDSSSAEIGLDKLLEVGSGSTSLSSGCYSSVVDALMKQTEKPFTVVMDEFNCYYDHGHYAHMEYDENVHNTIPLNKITILKPFIEAMGLYPSVAGTKLTNDASDDSTLTMMKWGSIIAATSESRAVNSKFTNSLTDAAYAQSKVEQHPVHVVDVRRFSSIEVQHVLYNFEVTGIGRLRFDRGDTALNPDEVAYLRMISGGLGQPLLDACMIP